MLEGGYNFEAIGNCVEAVVQAMLGEKMRKEENGLTDSEKKWGCWLPKWYHRDVDEVVEFVGKYWPEVKGEKAREYEEKVKRNEGRVFGVYEHESSSESGEDGSGSSLGEKKSENEVK